MTPRRLDPDSVLGRLRVMSGLLDHLDLIRSTDVDLTQMAVRLQVERIVSALVDLAVAVNTHVVVSAGHQAPADMSDSFDRAVVAGLVDAELARSLRPSVGLRNVIVHAYLDVDLQLLAEAIPFAAERYRRYVATVAQWLASKAP